LVVDDFKHGITGHSPFTAIPEITLYCIARQSDLVASTLYTAQAGFTLYSLVCSTLL
jgi:hypothetical protein